MNRFWMLLFFAAAGGGVFWATKRWILLPRSLTSQPSAEIVKSLPDRHKESIQHTVWGIRERVRLTLPGAATDTHEATVSSAADNAFLQLLYWTRDDATLTQIRNEFEDHDIEIWCDLDAPLVELADHVKREQNKSFQRVVLFLPHNIGPQSYNEWYFSSKQ